jgi:hypothetical protein
VKNVESIYQKIQSAFWDYNIDPSKLYLILLDKNPSIGSLTKEKILLRLIETLSWYEILDLLGKDYLRKNLTKDITNKIRNSVLRERYEYVRRILQNEALSSSGWSDENRKRLKTSIPSHWRNSS